MPKVSVIIPVYGVEKFIERCAVSLFEQTLNDIEYIFVDDCTPDRSIEILESIIEKYRLRLSAEKKTVRIERMPTNSGQAAVRRHGVQLATGVYIIHCDSDDWVDVDMYRAMYEKAVEEDADVVVCDYKRVNSEGNTISVVKACHTEEIHEFRKGILFQRDPWSLWNKMFRKTSYYKELDYPTGAMGEDMVICIQLLYNCNKLAYCPEVFYNYYINSLSITNVLLFDKCYNRYEQLKGNTEILLNFLSSTRHNDIKVYRKITDTFKFYVAWYLLNIIHIPKYRRLWVTELKSMNSFFLFNEYIGLNHRICMVMAFLHLYPTKKNRAIL